jgi:hypothetical protein
LDDQRTFLISLVTDDKISQEIKEVALRIIVLFGKLKGSAEDFLTVINLINTYKIGINLYNELNFEVNKNKELQKDESQDNSSFRIDLDGNLL